MIIQEDEDKTICELVDDIKSNTIPLDTGEAAEFLDMKLNAIKHKVYQTEKQLKILNERIERMSSKLIDYCNATEVLNKISTGK